MARPQKLCPSHTPSSHPRQTQEEGNRPGMAAERRDLGKNPAQTCACGRFWSASQSPAGLQACPVQCPTSTHPQHRRINSRTRTLTSPARAASMSRSSTTRQPYALPSWVGRAISASVRTQPTRRHSRGRAAPAAPGWRNSLAATAASSGHPGGASQRHNCRLTDGFESRSATGLQAGRRPGHSGRGPLSGLAGNAESSFTAAAGSNVIRPPLLPNSQGGVPLRECGRRLPPLGSGWQPPINKDPASSPKVISSRPQADCRARRLGCCTPPPAWRFSFSDVWGPGPATLCCTTHKQRMGHVGRPTFGSQPSVSTRPFPQLLRWRMARTVWLARFAYGDVPGR